MNKRYKEKYISFPARFTKEQEEKRKRLARKLGVPEAEVLRILLDKYDIR